MNSTILFILHLPPPIHGASMVGKYIHDSKVINEAFYCHYINLTTAKNLEDIGHFRLGKIIEFVKLLRRIRKTIIGLHPDLVYVTPNACGGAFYKDFVVVEMVKSMGCKVVAHYHNKGVATRQDRWLDDKLYKKFFKGIKVILLAKALYNDIQKYVKPDDVYICPNGIPDINGRGIAIPDGHNKTSHLLFLSNLLISKGVLVLLDALRKLKEQHYSFICDFVGGETSDLNAFSFNEEVKKRGLEGMAIYHGKKYGKDKQKFYANSDIFVFPTFYSNECFPLVLLEAMQQSLPCISTNEGGISDIIEDNKTGMIVNRKSPEDLANKLAWMLDHPEEREMMGKQGFERYHKYFTLDVFENRFKDILSQIIYKQDATEKLKTGREYV